MNRLRLALALLLAGAAAVIPGIHGALVTHAAGPAGQWNALIVEQCDRNPGNETLCDALLPPWVERTVASFQANCTASGMCSYSEVVAYTGTGKGAPTCSLSVATNPFVSQCTLYFAGNLIIGQDGPVPTFRVTDETLYFYGNLADNRQVLAIHNPLPSYPFDLQIPVIAGTFTNTTQNLQILGALPPGVAAPAGVTVNAVITQRDAPGPIALSLPLPEAVSGAGTSSAFAVGWFSAHAGYGQVNFGAGPGCSGLVETATSDLVPRSTAHLIVVSGNDLPGTVGDVGILPGTAYQFQTQTAYGGGTEVDTNGGACYTVTIPKP